MTNLVVSLSTILGSEVFAGKGQPVAVVCDVICNKDTGKITYFIVCPQSVTEGSLPPDYYAIHHSFFYLEGEEQQLLTFNAKLGNDEHSFFLDLPPQYDESEVQDLADFNRYINLHSAAAGHRSDYD